ncbi:MAG: hypothetical protein K6D57_06710 [Paludibacteraceae bacterium]|nr:hypothetical protein [Paludibacteraceae bacterium]
MFNRRSFTGSCRLPRGLTSSSACGTACSRKECHPLFVVRGDCLDVTESVARRLGLELPVGHHMD